MRKPVIGIKKRGIDRMKSIINKWPNKVISGGKRANVGTDGEDWFVGFGKHEGCYFEGTWWDMICFARNVLASENTKLAAREYWRPEWKNNNYTGGKPYKFEEVEE